MQILNITGARIKLPIGNAGLILENGTISDHIILTPGILKLLLPLTTTYKTKIRICVNSSELGIFDTIGFPVENVVDIETLKSDLAKYLDPDDKIKEDPDAKEDGNTKSNEKTSDEESSPNFPEANPDPIPDTELISEGNNNPVRE